LATTCNKNEQLQDGNSNAEYNPHNKTNTCTYVGLNKVRELILEGLFIMHLYQLDTQSTKFTI